MGIPSIYLVLAAPASGSPSFSWLVTGCCKIALYINLLFSCTSILLKRIGFFSSQKERPLRLHLKWKPYNHIFHIRIYMLNSSEWYSHLKFLFDLWMAICNRYKLFNFLFLDFPEFIFRKIWENTIRITFSSIKVAMKSKPIAHIFLCS